MSKWHFLVKEWMNGSGSWRIGKKFFNKTISDKFMFFSWGIHYRIMCIVSIDWFNLNPGWKQKWVWIRICGVRLIIRNIPHGHLQHMYTVCMGLFRTPVDTAGSKGIDWSPTWILIPLQPAEQWATDCRRGDHSKVVSIESLTETLGRVSHKDDSDTPLTISHKI